MPRASKSIAWRMPVVTTMSCGSQRMPRYLARKSAICWRSWGKPAGSALHSCSGVAAASARVAHLDQAGMGNRLASARRATKGKPSRTPVSDTGTGSENGPTGVVSVNPAIKKRSGTTAHTRVPEPGTRVTYASACRRSNTVSMVPRDNSQRSARVRLDGSRLPAGSIFVRMAERSASYAPSCLLTPALSSQLVGRGKSRACGDFPRGMMIVQVVQ